jgi:ribonuclease P protein component
MNDEAHFSAEQSGSEAPSRFPRSHGDPRWPQCDPRAPFARPQEPERLISTPENAVAPAMMVRRADFLAANRGRRAPMPGFVLLVRERGDGDPAMRYGITVTKKVGGAVIRNRMKRRFRVLARELLPTLGIAGADHVLIGRDGGIERDFSLLHAELSKALGKIMTRPIDPPRDPSRRKGKPRPAETRAKRPSPSDAPSGRHLPANGEE